MCGISALIGRADSLAASHIVVMTDLVAHRGPDGDGFVALSGKDLEAQSFEAGNASVAGEIRVLLGHRRLAIVDLSDRGRQPMASADGMLWITYNGEVYNHLELRIELERQGHRFTSTSDTEVILAAYAQWGEDCVHRFNGMFAFVLVDRRQRKIWAVRDRFGVKPLYFWRGAAGVLAFASEIKQFSTLPGWCAKLNGQRARDFLLAGAYEHTSETLFEGVNQLRGGEAMHIALDTDREPRVHRWYNLRARPFSGAFEDAKVGFWELLTDAVRLRLRADVSVGSCLSGGLDSSAIVCIASDLIGNVGGAPSQLAFTALSDSERYDERRYAQAVVQSSRVEWHTVTPAPDRLLEVLDDLVWAQDEPFGSTSIFAQSEVFRLAAESRIKVMLDGQGADESLGGYPVFRGAMLAELFKRLNLIRGTQELWSAPSGTLRLTMGALAPPSMVDRARSRLALQSSTWIDHARMGVKDGQAYAAGSSAARGDFESLSREQLLTSSLPALLHWEDRNSMAHSVEARVPFLDYRLVEYVLGLPSRFKFRSGLGKRVLRESMAGTVPEAVLQRKDKLGFQLAEDEWMIAHVAIMRSLLEDSVRASDGIVRPAILDIFDQFVAGRRPYSFLFWRVILFARWMQRYQVASA